MRPRGFDFEWRPLDGDDMTANQQEEIQGAGIIKAIGMCLVFDAVLVGIYKIVMVVAA